LAYTTG